MSEDDPKLIITYILVEKNPFESFIFLKKKYSIDELTNQITINIPKELFGVKKEKKIIDFQLFYKDSNNSGKLIYKFYIYYGINKAYLFLSNKRKKFLFELYFKEKKTIIYEDMKLIESDYFDTDSRRRMVLINSPLDIQIEGSVNFIYDYVTEELRMKKENSFCISIFDVDKSYYGSKIIKNESNFSIISELIPYESKLKKFKDELDVLISSKDGYIDKQIGILVNNNFIYDFCFNFCKNVSELKEDFKSNNEYYLMYLYYLWYILYICYSKNIGYKVPSSIMIHYLNDFYDNYLKDEDLLPYQRTLLFLSNSIYFTVLQNDKIYDSKKLRYIKRKNIKDNSVYGLALKFIENFINNLNSKSFLFYPLLLLNNGIFYYRKDSVYGFDVQNCENIKAHLNALIPEIFFEIEEEVTDITKYKNGFNYIEFQMIFINRSTLLKNFTKSPESFEYSNDDEKKLVKSYAVKVSKTLIHEGFGLNQYIYNSSRNIPLKFFSEKNDLVSIVSPHSGLVNNDVILTGFEPNKGESGKFLEFFFGHYRSKLIISLMLEIDDISKLYDSIDYFVKEDLTEIKKYIVMKYVLKNKRINYVDDPQLNLEEENKKLEKIFNEHYINDLNDMKCEVFENIKLNCDSNNVYYMTKSEIKGYDYYRRKANEAKDHSERAMYLWQLLNHLKSCC